MSPARGLFSAPSAAPLARPSKRKRGKGSVRNTAYSGPRRCEDCEQAVYEALMAGSNNGQVIRQAKFRRTEGDVAILVCAEHKNDRELDQQ